MAIASRPVEFIVKGYNGDEKWVQGETGQVHRREIIQEFLNKQKQSLAQRFRELKAAGEKARKEKYLTLILLSMFPTHPLTDVFEMGHVKNQGTSGFLYATFSFMAAIRHRILG